MVFKEKFRMRILHSSQINPTRISNFPLPSREEKLQHSLFFYSFIKALSKQFIFSFSYYKFYHYNYASYQFIAFHQQIHPLLPNMWK